jgi:Protein of unknown function (DUF1269)
VGVLFPPSILGAAVVGAGGGALISRMTRGLGRGKVKDLGEALDSGAMTILVVCPAVSTNAVCNSLKGARTTTTAPTSTTEEVKPWAPADHRSVVHCSLVRSGSRCSAFGGAGVGLLGGLEGWRGRVDCRMWVGFWLR